KGGRVASVALKLKLEEIITKLDSKALEGAFQSLKQKQVGAILVVSRPLFAERKRLVELAAKYRLPAIYPQKEYMNEGGLMYYGADFDDLFRRSAHYVDKILNLKVPNRLTCRYSRRRSLTLSLTSRLPNRLV